jgi:hypothetical protein
MTPWRHGKGANGAEFGKSQVSQHNALSSDYYQTKNVYD